ncbi:MAG: hypothetical protein HZB55_02430 [Deltaproteobacteria bacterium]|nr:hypothetical protein [Deltaproteobacteria bacterium]
MIYIPNLISGFAGTTQRQKCLQLVAAAIFTTALSATASLKSYAGDLDQYDQMYALSLATVNGTFWFEGRPYLPGDGALAGWKDSYILASLLDMYEVTGDVKYLTRFTNLTEQIFPHAVYRPLFTARYTTSDQVLNGNFEDTPDSTQLSDVQATTNGGFENADPNDPTRPLAWRPFSGSSASYALERGVPISSAQDAYKNNSGDLRNPDFESVDVRDPTLPMAWRRWQSASDTARLVTTTKSSGRRALSLVTSPSRGWQVIEQPLRYEPSKVYVVAFDAATNGTVGGRVLAYDATDSRVLAQEIVSNKSWRRHILSFSSPATVGHTLLIRIYHTDYRISGGEIFVDNMKLFTDGDQYLRLSTNPAMGSQSVSQDIHCAKDKYFILQFWAMTTEPKYGGEVVVYNKTTGSILAKKSFYNTKWSRMCVLFRTPAAPAETLCIVLRHAKWDVPADDFFDELAITDPQELGAVGYYGVPFWTRWQAGPDTAHLLLNDGGGPRPLVNAENKIQEETGNLLAEVGTSPSDGWQALEQAVWYVPKAQYEVRYTCRASGPGGGRLVVWDSTTPTVLLEVKFFNTEWKYGVATFVAPSVAGHELKVRLTHTDYRDVGNKVQLDNLSIRRCYSFMVHEGLVGTQLARFSKMVKRDIDLARDLGPLAAAYETLLRAGMIPAWEPFWIQVDSFRGLYISPPDGRDAPGGQSLPYNQMLAFGRVFTALSSAEGNPVDRERAGNLAATFHASLKFNGSAYQWHYWDQILPGESRIDKVEGTGYAGIDVAFAESCWALGTSFSDEDITRFSNTFLDRVWNGDREYPAFTYTIDGLGPPMAPAEASIADWLVLAKFDPRLVEVARTFVQRYWDEWLNIGEGPSSNRVGAYAFTFSEILRGN